MNSMGLVLSTIAGLSSIIGFFAIFIDKDQDKIIGSSLGLASGAMITLSVIDLLPSAINYFKLSYYSFFAFIFCLLFIVLGFLVSILINDTIKNSNNLYKLGLISFITLILHNIPEGVITYLATVNTLEKGFLLFISIALHNIPEGIAIAVPVYYATKNKFKAFLLVFISGIAEPLGSLLAIIFIRDIPSNMFLSLFYALITGMMVSISFTELLPESKYYNKKYTYIFILIGSLLIICSHLLI